MSSSEKSDEKSYAKQLQNSIQNQLETDGTLAKLRSELHVKVLKMMCGPNVQAGEPLCGRLLLDGKEQARSPLNILVIELIKEYIDWFGYKHTMETLAMETGTEPKAPLREKLEQSLGYDFKPQELPILLNMVSEAYEEKQQRMQQKTPTEATKQTNLANAAKQASPANIAKQTNLANAAKQTSPANVARQTSVTSVAKETNTATLAKQVQVLKQIYPAKASKQASSSKASIYKNHNLQNTSKSANTLKFGKTNKAPLASIDPRSTNNSSMLVSKEFTEVKNYFEGFRKPKRLFHRADAKIEHISVNMSLNIKTSSSESLKSSTISSSDSQSSELLKTVSGMRDQPPRLDAKGLPDIAEDIESEDNDLFEDIPEGHDYEEMELPEEIYPHGCGEEGPCVTPTSSTAAEQHEQNRESKLAKNQGIKRKAFVVPQLFDQDTANVLSPRSQNACQLESLQLGLTNLVASVRAQVEADLTTNSRCNPYMQESKRPKLMHRSISDTEVVSSSDAIKTMMSKVTLDSDYEDIEEDEKVAYCD